MGRIKNGLKIGGIGIGGFAILLSVIFGCGLFSFGYYKFFAPKYANVEREVFENTKSFNHGKVQDLVKYYEEYTKASIDEKESIRQLILMNFANFDSNKITNSALKSFLISQRGY
jgi:hypothetical protein